MPTPYGPHQGPSGTPARPRDGGAAAARAGRPPVRPVGCDSRPQRPRWARADLATATLQGIILLTAVALLIVLLWSQRAARARQPEPMDWKDRSRLPMILAGQMARRDDVRVEPIGVERPADPERVKSVLRAGKTYEILVKGGLTAALTEQDSAEGHGDRLAYVFEMRLRRAIQSNDGRRIVALLHFDQVRMVKLLTAVDDLQIDLGAPGEPILDRLAPLAPEAGIAVVDPAPVAYAVLGRTARAVAHSPTSRAFVETDPLSGKTVRLTYQAAAGVESIEPIGCVLDNWQAQFLFRTALLSDCFLVPSERAAVGETWRVDARQLLGYLDPSIRGRPEGEVTIRQAGQYQRDGKRYCILRLQSEVLDLKSCIMAREFLGRLRPTGTFRFNVSDGHVAGARLSWRIERAHFWECRLLFERDFQGKPELAIDYCCRLR